MQDILEWDLVEDDDVLFYAYLDAVTSGYIPRKKTLINFEYRIFKDKGLKNNRKCLIPVEATSK